MKILKLVKRIPKYVRNNGIFAFLSYLLATSFISFISLILYPLKKNARNDPFYAVFNKFLGSVNNIQGPKVLEIGSRNVTGVVWRNRFNDSVSYTGFDIHHGDNVDVVGDVHTLSTHLKHDYYDAVFSISVFEHLAMPWKAVLEINKVLKPGGLLYISTHPVWPQHELPWDFWRYSTETFKILFNASTGFEIIDCEEGTPGRIISLSKDSATSTTHLANINQSIAIIAKKVDYPDSQLSWDIPIDSILNTQYPKDK